MEDFLTLTHATERDVDLLLIEELRCSTAFVMWFVQRLGCDAYERSMVFHSKRRIFNRREIDITLTLDGPAGKSVILIENKLDTQEQPQQAESYREEAQTLIERREATAVYTVLVCPARYAVAASSFAQKFDHIVNYEEIADHLAMRASNEGGELGARLRHRCDLMNQAISKARRGYEPVPLAEIDDFAEKYVAMLLAERIDLEPGPSMIKAGRPGESRTMVFSPATLPKWPFLPQTRLVHQLRDANANVNFYTWGGYSSELTNRMAADLKGTGFQVVATVNKRAGGRSGVMIVTPTPAVDSLADFEN